MLNCIKFAYLKLEKEGLTPLDFTFPSFSITTNQYKQVGMNLLEDKVRMKIDSGEYGIDFGFENIEKINKKIQEGIATDNEIVFFKNIENKITKKIEADSAISKIEISHSIINKLCGDTMSVMLAQLSYFQGFKEPKLLSARQANKIKSSEHLITMSTIGPIEENKFVASLIMLKGQLPRAYKVANQALKIFGERSTNVTDFHEFDLKNPKEYKLVQKMIVENQLIRNMVYRIQQNEKAPSISIVEEIANIDKKFAQENFPLQMQKAKQNIKVTKHSYNF